VDDEIAFDTDCNDTSWW